MAHQTYFPYCCWSIYQSLSYFSGVALVNPIAGYMSRDGLGSWRRTFQALAAVIALVSTIYMVLVLIPAVRRKLHSDEYEKFPDTSQEKENPNQNIMFTIAQLWCMDARAVMWLSGIFGVGFAIFIPRTIFVSLQIIHQTTTMIITH